MARQNRELPTPDEIKSSVLAELHYHRKNSEHEDITSYVDVDHLVHVAAGLTLADADPELSEKLERRTKAVLRRMERDGLVTHWVSENWYVTDVGMQYR
jgi:hypothetical protein